MSSGSPCYIDDNGIPSGNKTELDIESLDYIVDNICEILERTNPLLELDAFRRDDQFKGMFEEIVNLLLSYGLGLELED